MESTEAENNQDDLTHKVELTGLLQISGLAIEL